VRHGCLNDSLDQFLRFRARNKSAFVAQKNATGEFHRAEEMLKRLALATAPDQFTERRQFRFRQRPFELQIKLDSSALKRVCQQVFSVQTRTFDITLLEVSGGRLKYLEKGHSFLLQIM